ncbi:WD repeat-containing protein 96 [Cricetulus griseus]|uniref:WD repeat-containing protein 96 n=1 Tax=Cricetulus griseus TaxID=10029 RepID=A0A061I7J9_CRIGR|nr:WD repeat-containing protein 96 [Cricetulus griseus]
MHCWTASSDLYIGCEEGHLLMVNSETLKVTVLQKMEELPLTGYSLWFSLVIVRGSVYIYTYGAEPPLDKVLESCDGKVQAMDFITPGSKHFLTLTNSGEIAALWIEDCTCTSKIYLGTPKSCKGFPLICSNKSPLKGARNSWKSFTVFLPFVHVAVVSYDQRGIFLLAGTVEGNIFVIDARPSKSFQVFGYTETSKDILQISTVSLPISDVVEVLVLSPLPETGRSRLKYFTLPITLSQVSDNFYDERGRLHDELIHKLLYEVEHSLSSAVLSFESNKIYGFCSQVPYICSYLLPEEITSMMEENEKMDPISKLDQQEFCLDPEELERLNEESEEEVAKVKKDVEMHNLAKNYLTELIKEECWNSMAVKGRALKCFHIPYVVDNFPMKERTEEELLELKRVLQQKKTEAECLKLRKEIIEVQSSATLLKKHHDEDDEEEEDEEKTIDSSLPNYLLGSLSTDFGADTSLLTSQLELHSREEKINQIILLKDIIYKVKKAFNSEFDAARKQKEIEIARVKEKNVRIGEIISDLELEEKVWQPVFEDCEKPERALVVEDDEASNARQRGLMDMMGGVLEVKKEDILRMVIPQPAFMTKSDAVWTEEERKQFKEYEKKVKELNEERDKYRKSLETELKKLQNSIQESTQNFDEHLKRLFERRVKAEMVINQEELKINNLVFSLLLDEELNSREQFLNNYLLKKQEEKSKSSKAIQKAKEDLDVFKEQHDILVAEDKVKQKAAGLQEMTSFLRKRLEDDEVVQHEIERVFQELLRLQEEKVKFQVNLTIQVLLKQGQVELENFQLSLEYSDAILINKNIIEDLNSVIRYLNEANYENVIAIQIGLTEQTLNAIEKVSLEHMDHYNAIISEPMLTCEKIARERYENLLKKQKLTNISKQQAEQISILQAEVERLRMKTFPALIPM